MVELARCHAALLLLLLACAPAEREPIAPAPPVSAPTLAPRPTTSVLAPALQVCERGMVVADDGSVDDFEDGDSQALLIGGRSGYWFTAVDNHGSTVEPKGELRPIDGGPSASKRAVRVVGRTMPELPAWGAVTGLSWQPDNRPYDGSKYAGVSFWAKVGPTSAGTFRLKLSDVNTHPVGGVCRDEPGGCWNHFGADLRLTSEWKKYELAFADLTQEAGWGQPRPPALSAHQLVSLDFSVPRGQEFELWIDDVKLLRCQ